MLEALAPAALAAGVALRDYVADACRAAAAHPAPATGADVCGREGPTHLDAAGEE